MLRTMYDGLKIPTVFPTFLKDIFDFMIEEHLIGMRKNTFGVTGITKEISIWEMEGVTSKLPMIEDLAIRIREIHKREGIN